MKNNPFVGKSTRTRTFTVITVVALILLIALNLFVTSLGIFGTAHIDMTPEGLYTLRPLMVDVCKNIFYTDGGELRDPGIKITFCDDPDNLISNTYTRVVYYMALSLSEEFDNCEVETVNVRMDPNSVAEYKATSLTDISSTDVIISCGSRYRIASAESFWRIGTEKVYSYDGEYKLASIMLSLTLVNKPMAYFVTDHGEDYYDPSAAENAGNAKTTELANLLSEKGLGIKTLSLSALIDEAEKAGNTPSIPDDCVLLIINNPKEDFEFDETRLGSFGYVSETELLDRYMTKAKGSIMVAKDYRTSLPNFEDFLKEWGIECTHTLVKDYENYIKTDGEDGLTLIADYNTDAESYAYSVYGEYASLASSPRVVIGDTGHIVSAFGDSDGSNESGTPNTSRVFAPFLYSSAQSTDYGKNSATGEYVFVGETGRKAIAAIAGRQKINEDTGDYTYSYIFCAASADFFSDTYLGNASYANYDVMASAVQSIARLDTYAPSELGGTSLNSDNGLGKMLRDMTIQASDQEFYEWNGNSYSLSKVIHGLTNTEKIIITVVVAVIPMVIAVIGIVVCIRRKYL